MSGTTVAECQWRWVTETSNQLLQFRILNTPQAYSRPQDEYTRSLELGEQAHVRARPAAGVDVEWVQNGMTVALSYSKVGPAVADASAKADDTS